MTSQHQARETDAVDVHILADIHITQVGAERQRERVTARPGFIPQMGNVLSLSSAKAAVETSSSGTSVACHLIIFLPFCLAPLQPGAHVKIDRLRMFAEGDIYTRS